MAYKTGNFYGQYEKWKSWNGKDCVSVKIHKLEADLCTEYKWGDYKFFNNIAEAEEYIKEHAPNQNLRWSKESVNRNGHIEASIEEEKECSWLKPVWELTTYYKDEIVSVEEVV